MAAIDIFYLALVLVAFTGFAAVLAYFTSVNARLKKRALQRRAASLAVFPIARGFGELYWMGCKPVRNLVGRASR